MNTNLLIKIITKTNIFLSIIFIFILFVINGCATVILNKNQSVLFTGSKNISLTLQARKSLSLKDGPKDITIKRAKQLDIMVKCSESSASKSVSIPTDYNNLFIFGNAVLYTMFLSTTLIIGPAVLFPWFYFIDLISGEAYKFNDILNLDWYCQ